MFLHREKRNYIYIECERVRIPSFFTLGYYILKLRYKVSFIVADCSSEMQLISLLQFYQYFKALTVFTFAVIPHRPLLSKLALLTLLNGNKFTSTRPVKIRFLLQHCKFSLVISGYLLLHMASMTWLTAALSNNIFTQTIVWKYISYGNRICEWICLCVSERKKAIVHP